MITWVTGPMTVWFVIMAINLREPLIQVPLEQERQRGVPSRKTLFCCYWLV